MCLVLVPTRGAGQRAEPGLLHAGQDHGSGGHPTDGGEERPAVRPGAADPPGPAAAALHQGERCVATGAV